MTGQDSISAQVGGIAERDGISMQAAEQRLYSMGPGDLNAAVAAGQQNGQAGPSKGPVRGPAGSWEYLGLWRNGGLHMSETAAQLPCDDLNAARLMVDERPDELHYAVMSGTWHIWDGTCHRPDREGKAAKIVAHFAARYEMLLGAATETARQLAVRDLPDEVTVKQRNDAVAAALKPWERAVRYAAGLRRSGGQVSLLKQLSVNCSVADEELELENPDWLNCANGTVDLRTGLIRPHDPSDMLTYCVPVAYTQAKCPQFERMVYRMCGNDAEVYFDALKVLGYALLGYNPDQVVFFIKGPTKSGKSQVLFIVRRILGVLGHESQADLITVVRHGRNARTENSIRGKRLVTITETSSFMHIDEAQLKRITGEPEISVDQHYAKEELRTQVTWLIVLATNDMPSLTHFDDAMRERIIVIPAGDTIPLAERDKHLAKKIIAEEAEGVLALLVGACAEYHRTGLQMPLKVQVETDTYRGLQNTVANFIRECCTMVTTQWPATAGAIPMTQAWYGYRDWSRGEGRLSRNEFYDEMSRQPGVTRNDSSNANRRFEGLQWNAETAGKFTRAEDSGS